MANDKNTPIRFRFKQKLKIYNAHLTTFGAVVYGYDQWGHRYREVTKHVVGRECFRCFRPYDLGFVLVGAREIGFCAERCCQVESWLVEYDTPQAYYVKLYKQLLTGVVPRPRREVGRERVDHYLGSVHRKRAA
jgi:hypothetical protein